MLSTLSDITDPRSFIAYYFTAKAVHVTSRSCLAAGKAVDPDHFFDELWLDYISEHRLILSALEPDSKKKPQRLKEADLKKALDENLRMRRAQLEIDTLKKISHVPNGAGHVASFTRAITGSDSALDIAVISHWLWMVKRKASGKSVINHIMPVFFGAQGGGKTRAIEKLLSPVEAYTLNLKVSDLTDSRLSPSIASSWVVFCDELAGVEKADFAALKNLITSKSVSARRLYSNNSLTLDQRASILGASNISVDLSFTDTTGLRRFPQIICLPRMDWEHITALNPLQIWQEIDESREEGYLTGECLQAFLATQETLRTRDSVEQFTEDMLVPATLESLVEVNQADVYKAYLQFCEASTQKANSLNFFCKKMKQLGYEAVRKRDHSGARARVISIHPDSEILLSVHQFFTNVIPFRDKK